MHQQHLFESADPPPEDDLRADLSQYMTPRWVSEHLVERFGPISDTDHVLDLCCGRGSFLHAARAANVHHATGIELDPTLAAMAHADTGYPILVGDFTTMTVDFEPSIIVSNPPFTADDIEAAFRRCSELLGAGGRAGLLIPCHSLSFASRMHTLLAGFSATTSLLPRDIYPRLSFALSWVELERTPTQRLTGFLLFGEALAMRSMRSQYRAILNDGRKPLWREVLEMALTACGGEASLSRVYEIVENYRPTTNPFWRDAIRREAGEHFERVGPGVFRLPKANAA